MATLAVLLLLCFGAPFPARYSDLHADQSLRLTDRQGRSLRSVLSHREGTDTWVSLEQMAPYLVQAVLVSEDRRFRYHPGVDPLAIARAVKDNLVAGEVVSGASTLTQQLLRTLSAPAQRGLGAKAAEAYWAVRLEARTSKEEVLEAYLNRVAFGPAVYGAEEASRYYFGKPAKALSLAESVLLAVLIRAPASFDPWTQEGRAELKPWTDDLLARMEVQGLVSADSAQRARQEEWLMSLAPPPFLAPHFCEMVLPQLQGYRGEQRTSLDLDLQRQVEGMIANHLRLLNGHRVGNAAVLVADAETGEVLAMAGSADFHRARDGQFNAAISLRQPGSTLKPFTYGLLLRQVGHAGHILPDLPIYSSSDIASFIPENYDGRFHGPVSIRTALGSSYNVPVVKALERVGVETLLLKLRELGMVDLRETPEHYGLGLTLGDGSVSLWQLVEAYRVLARQGQHSPLTLLHDQPTAAAREVFEPSVAALITDVLSDRRARIPSFGSPNVLEFAFPVAVKTGTSKGYRDNWCLGYTPKHVVGVWVGNSDGSPMEHVSGITGAGPLFRDVMLTLGDGGDFAQAALEDRDICSLSGLAATANCPHRAVEPGLPEIVDQPCDVCVLATVDRRTGAQATPDTPNAHRLEQLRFKVDPIYGQWAQENNLPLVETAQRREDGFRLVYPLNDDTFLLDRDLRASNQKVMLRAVGGRAPYRWSVDGVALDSTGLQAWWVLKPGSHQIRIVDSTGEEDSLAVSVVGGS
jgi:penicillin-binding protein 1C